MKYFVTYTRIIKKVSDKLHNLNEKIKNEYSIIISYILYVFDFLTSCIFIFLNAYLKVDYYLSIFEGYTTLSS